MGCNCGGKAKMFVVRYPNGATRTFLTRAEADSAAAGIIGATVVEKTP